ncbi:hypothetical protein [Pseudonocardia lacus]|uniref:hypothetical protein n=1 Tax=Pseudonocardia lacus TaxID=2835865 RepID=UPI001BDBF48B|nr:hypothetical protein [Pseudonocardia lacus]
MSDGLDGRARLRLEELRQRLDGAAEQIAVARPDAAEDIRAGFGELRHRLERVHEFCDEVDEHTWAAYTTGLDRSLAELATAVADGPAVDDVVYARTGRLEVDGWVLRLDLAGRDAPVEGRELVAGAARELDDYQAAVGAGEAPSRAGVERALNELRGAAE